MFRDLIINLSGKHHRIGQQECVGHEIYKVESDMSNESKKADSIKKKPRKNTTDSIRKQPIKKQPIRKHPKRSQT